MNLKLCNNIKYVLPTRPTKVSNLKKKIIYVKHILTVPLTQYIFSIYLRFILLFHEDFAQSLSLLFEIFRHICGRMTATCPCRPSWPGGTPGGPLHSSSRPTSGYTQSLLQTSSGWTPCTELIPVNKRKCPVTLTENHLNHEYIY